MRWMMLGAMLLVSGMAVAQPKPGTPPIPPGGQNSSFNLVNRGTIAIRELFVTAAGNANWGQNRLDGKAGAPTQIAAGGSYAVRRRVDTNCIFDIKVVFADGKAEERKGVNTCAVEDVSIGGAPGGGAPVAATGKAADDPSFKLFNRAAREIKDLRAVPAGGSGAGENRLATPLPPDVSRQIVIAKDGNCIFDLRVVFADGSAKERKRVNLCKIAEMAVP